MESTKDSAKSATKQFYVETGLNIKNRRTMAGITQEDFAAMLDIGMSSLCHIEIGKHKPSLDVINKICAILNCQYSELLPPIIPVEIKTEVRMVQVLKNKTIIKKTI